jgi:hypothetical protein
LQSQPPIRAVVVVFVQWIAVRRRFQESDHPIRRFVPYSTSRNPASDPESR